MGNYRNNRSNGSFNSNKGNYRSQGQKKKHSGCKRIVGKNGVEYITGWNFSKSKGMMSFIAGFRHNFKSGQSPQWQSRSGVVYDKMVATITLGPVKHTVSCLYDPIKKKLRFPNSWVASLNAPNGGFWGQISKR